ncbi:MAG: GNAT family N-acetyltransferase [Bacteroidales bacterium]|nr:GNAT family N-acetyltransferase [Bacteroidales bacterium]
MKTLLIRRVFESELPQLQQISIQTFEETFRDHCLASDLDLFLNEAYNQPKLLEEFQNPESEFFFATINNQIVGYLKINRNLAQTEFLLENAFELERIYLLSDFQGQGIGQALFNKALDLANSAKNKYIWLGVWENNHRAIQFYKKNGFEVFDQHLFKVGNDPQTDLLMKRQL